MKFSIGLAADSLKDSCFSGEVFASKITNMTNRKLYVFVQTRQLKSFAKKLFPFRGAGGGPPPPKRGKGTGGI